MLQYLYNTIFDFIFSAFVLFVLNDDTLITYSPGMTWRYYTWKEWIISHSITPIYALIIEPEKTCSA